MCHRLLIAQAVCLLLLVLLVVVPCAWPMLPPPPQVLQGCLVSIATWLMHLGLQVRHMRYSTSEQPSMIARKNTQEGISQEEHATGRDFPSMIASSSYTARKRLQPQHHTCLSCPLAAAAPRARRPDGRPPRVLDAQMSAPTLVVPGPCHGSRRRAAGGCCRAWLRARGSSTPWPQGMVSRACACCTGCRLCTACHLSTRLASCSMRAPLECACVAGLHRHFPSRARTTAHHQRPNGPSSSQLPYYLWVLTRLPACPPARPPPPGAATAQVMVTVRAALRRAKDDARRQHRHRMAPADLRPYLPRPAAAPGAAAALHATAAGDSAAAAGASAAAAVSVGAASGGPSTASSWPVTTRAAVAATAPLPPPAFSNSASGPAAAAARPPSASVPPSSAGRGGVRLAGGAVVGGGMGAPPPRFSAPGGLPKQGQAPLAAAPPVSPSHPARPATAVGGAAPEERGLQASTGTAAGAGAATPLLPRRSRSDISLGGFSPPSDWNGSPHDRSRAPHPPGPRSISSSGLRQQRPGSAAAAASAASMVSPPPPAPEASAYSARYQRGVETARARAAAKRQRQEGSSLPVRCRAAEAEGAPEARAGVEYWAGACCTLRAAHAASASLLSCLACRCRPPRRQAGRRWRSAAKAP